MAAATELTRGTGVMVLEGAMVGDGVTVGVGDGNGLVGVDEGGVVAVGVDDSAGCGEFVIVADATWMIWVLPGVRVTRGDNIAVSV